MDDDLSLYVPYHEPQRNNMRDAAAMARMHYAEQLRLQIRETYLARPTPSPTMWLVDVD